MLDLAASEKDVHADFYNGKRGELWKSQQSSKAPILDFEDLFDEDNLWGRQLIITPTAISRWAVHVVHNLFAINLIK